MQITSVHQKALNKTPLPITVTGLQLVGNGDMAGEVNQVQIHGIVISKLR
ncbi:MAG TPA: hypothetical protein H9856_04415 [Candidatus Limosilactobacillus merdigallinarum]|uniref:Uncharacterized protein n=1 Tax=Candidatus Limosilactobacillus merdigallinarum TaxID=2838652 RepID=A0A9D1VIP0_9LACO|nr:hypothetical protein [Candidatus Limosilactobacillus merdigallinarum]